MTGTGIMAGICISPYPIEKVEDSPYPLNARISRQNMDGFRQYSRKHVYLSSLQVYTRYDENELRI